MAGQDGSSEAHPAVSLNDGGLSPALQKLIGFIPRTLAQLIVGPLGAFRQAEQGGRAKRIPPCRRGNGGLSRFLRKENPPCGVAGAKALDCGSPLRGVRDDVLTEACALRTRQNVT